MTETDTTIIKSQPKKLYIVYDEEKEMVYEKQVLNYHIQKDSGYWKIAKMIVEHSSKTNTNTEFFLDSMDNEFKKNKDAFI